MYTPERLAKVLRNNGFEIEWVEASTVRLKWTVEVDCHPSNGGYGLSAYLRVDRSPRSSPTEGLMDLGLFLSVDALIERLRDILVHRKIY